MTTKPRLATLDVNWVLMFILSQGDTVGQQRFCVKRSWTLDPENGQTHRFKDGSIVAIVQAVKLKTKLGGRND